jgi:DMSO/TMAO reductase YedYZ molybdopterin-dependent catalytic subunit
MIIPGFIGGRMVKWLSEITVTEKESDNFYHYHDNRRACSSSLLPTACVRRLGVPPTRLCPGALAGRMGPPPPPGLSGASC